ncbi:TonB-dependent receptor [Aeromonas sobria]|nr:TonB-dependent receptor [Aeromonas sobria]
MSKTLLVAAALLPTAAFAQTTIPINPTLVITANRVEQPVSSVLAPVVVIDRAEIEARQIDNLPDLLKTLPGVQVTTLGGRGHQSSLYIRGAKTKHSLLLVNGRPVPTLVTGSNDLSQIPLGNIERVEYIRGPRAAIYGSDAISGVINLITKTSAKNGNETHVKGGVGSHGYGLGELRTVQALGQQTDMNMMIGYERTDGYDVRAQDGWTSLQPDRDGFAGLNGQVGLNHSFSDAWSADFNAQGFNNITESDGDYSDMNRNQAAQLDGGVLFKNDHISSRLEASYGENKLKTWLDNKGEASGEPIHTGLTRLSWVNNWNLIKGANITGGADWQREQLKSDSRSGGQSFTAPDRDNTGLFMVGSYGWNPFLFELSGRTDDNEQYGRHNTWSAASGLDVDENHHLRLSYGTAFKAPTFMDLYSPYSPKSDYLKPEESKNIELGLSGRYSAWDWSTNLYRNDINEMIDYGPDYRPYNIGEVRLEGVELAIGLDTGPFHHKVSYDYTRAQDRSKQDRQLDRVAKHKGSLITEVSLGSVLWSGEILYTGERTDLGATKQLPSYTVFNLAATYPATNALTLGGRIDNLFDRNYEGAYGYAAPGAEAKVTADYRF